MGKKKGEADAEVEVEDVELDEDGELEEGAEEEGTEGEEVEVAADAPKMKKKVTGITNDAKIEILVESNPKRSGSASYDRFEGYLTKEAPATVKAALENGLIMGDIHYDFIHGSIKVEGATVVEYAPAVRGPRDGTTSEEVAEEIEVDEDADGEEGDDNF